MWHSRYIFCIRLLQPCAECIIPITFLEVSNDDSRFYFSSPVHIGVELYLLSPVHIEVDRVNQHVFITNVYRYQHQLFFTREKGVADIINS